ncbi:unnamed protein product [Mytilus coruscus]|uniref:Exonuclease domain-containing protein n=1 Tax=Mytilus coruscus TaxID=42192 RepID=A0A6J8B2J6_MYTCO|nr:unnamed protein product [Mytilus coruscus]
MSMLKLDNSVMLRNYIKKAVSDETKSEVKRLIDALPEAVKIIDAVKVEGNTVTIMGKITKQIPSRLTINDFEEFIIFDLETTGLSQNSDITQIAASSGSNLFQRYIMQKCEINHEASKITGLTFLQSTNKMYLNRTIVQTCSIEQAALDFIDFLKITKQTCSGST